MIKKYIAVVITLLFIFQMFSCQNTQVIDTVIITPIEEPIRQVVNANDTIYQILVYAFADSNQDGVGDFKGIYNHIDYLEYLGIDTLWLSPIHPSPSYHGYDIIDYYDVKDIYEVDGYTFENLIEDLASVDIDVIMDIAINHTSNQHPYFKEAISAYIYNNENEYIDYFDFSKTSFTNPIYGYSAAYSRGVYYDAFYGYAHMPAWNFDHPQVKDMFLSVFDYWLDMGVAGFRLDAAKHIYDSQIKNIQLLKYYKEELEVKYDHVYFVNEVWSSENEIINYYASEMNNLDFNFLSHAKNAIEGSTYLSSYLSHFQEMIRLKYDAAQQAPFLSNHDIGRVGINYSENENKMLAALLLLSPGNSIVYYGDEIMLEGTRTLKDGDQGYEDAAFRTPMLWDSTTNKNAVYIQEGTSGIISNARTISTSTVEDNMNQTDSILSYYKQAIAIKKAHTILSTGKLEAVTLNQHLISYQVYDDDEVILVIHNASNQSIELEMNTPFDLLDFLTMTNDPVKTNQHLVIPSYSSIILSLDEPLEESNNPLVEDVFLRGTMTDWALSSVYKMTFNDGVYTFELTLNQLTEFKLYSDDIWYGFDAVISPDSSFVTEESLYGNIQIQPGSYLIEFTDGKITISIK
ncbi:MAG: alpha-amylase family glycosyl hydrolase [Acholeplasmataceae bacterium]|jgi:glycosidase|nr:alpha-amylase family glycosyl hydrolase [Acholeplasmataceae bacterium]